MARPLRIKFPDAWYHIMNRGRRGEHIFLKYADYLRFIELLQDSSEMWKLRIAAYCLMPNHYHLLVQTPDANISRCMRHIDGVYAQHFNRRYDCDGQLFRGRFKSILIEVDEYLLHLVRYIHRNPLKAGLVDRIDEYPWSSHKGYLSRADEWAWLYKDFLLSMLSKNKGDQLKIYRHFISQNDDNEEVVGKIIDKKRWPAILGSKDFIDQIKEIFFLKNIDDEIPQSKELAPDVDRIKKIICLAYNIEESELLRSKRGVNNEPKNVAIYLTRRLTGKKLKQIAEHYGINKYSSISSIIERMKASIAVDRKLRKRIENLHSAITKAKSQKQT
jgi:REP element-mobilizing transposase RayT